MKRVLRGRHTVLSNHHFRIRIVYSLNHPFSGFSGFKIEGYCTVYKIKRHSAPLIVRDCLSIRNAVSVNSFEPGTPGTLITTNVRACVCVPTHAQSCQSPCDPIDCSPAGSSARGIFSKNTGMGCHFLLQECKHRTHTSCVSCICRWILDHCTIWEANAFNTVF